MAEITKDDSHDPSPGRPHTSPPPILDISQWVERYVLMAGTLASRFPDKAPEFFAYLATIVRAERNYKPGSLTTSNTVVKPSLEDTLTGPKPTPRSTARRSQAERKPSLAADSASMAGWPHLCALPVQPKPPNIRMVSLCNYPTNPLAERTRYAPISIMVAAQAKRHRGAARVARATAR